MSHNPPNKIHKMYILIFIFLILPQITPTQPIILDHPIEKNDNVTIIINFLAFSNTSNIPTKYTLSVNEMQDISRPTMILNAISTIIRNTPPHIYTDPILQNLSTKFINLLTFSLHNLLIDYNQPFFQTVLHIKIKVDKSTNTSSIKNIMIPFDSSSIRQPDDKITIFF